VSLSDDVTSQNAIYYVIDHVILNKQPSCITDILLYDVMRVHEKKLSCYYYYYCIITHTHTGGPSVHCIICVTTRVLRSPTTVAVSPLQSSPIIIFYNIYINIITIHYIRCKSVAVAAAGLTLVQHQHHTIRFLSGAGRLITMMMINNDNNNNNNNNIIPWRVGIICTSCYFRIT